MENAIEVGQVIEFSYPRHNYLGVANRSRERRRLRIEQIRSLDQSPLAPITLSSDPLLCRGRRLVTGYDLRRRAERSFYVEQMADVIALEIAEQKLNVYLLGEGSAPEPVYTAESSEEAAAFVEQWCLNPHGLTIAVAPDDSDPFK